MLLGIDLVRDTLEKVKLIQERIRITESRQKSYDNRKVWDASFMEGEKVLLRVLLMKGVMRFGKRENLTPQYIAPSNALKRVGKVAYRLAFPPNLSGVHPVFHISMLQKYYEDPSYVLDFSLVQLDKDLTYNEEPMAILNRQVRKLRSKNIALVKVQLRGLGKVLELVGAIGKGSGEEGDLLRFK
ncbi:uncharacterized protein [Nicotiana sylvestris]|uniref:uncharacterized protein n=1 Tax=Nicotiana sylvestris TaxID=4096 RepID=UPI00388CC70D